ncbi:unnamed protein product [Ambrosiozyma monospora]|uniref:Unnamed protein product n=1 Tax=Ambrosiozyma monospora TaxID=43982 RepID=A0ACB5SZQ9_AMBMO|nr:unnamed protein product [Ambrosiozyma monospora]
MAILDIPHLTKFIDFIITKSIRIKEIHLGVEVIWTDPIEEPFCRCPKFEPKGRNPETNPKSSDSFILCPISQKQLELGCEKLILDIQFPRYVVSDHMFLMPFVTSLKLTIRQVTKLFSTKKSSQEFKRLKNLSVAIHSSASDVDSLSRVMGNLENLLQLNSSEPKGILELAITFGYFDEFNSEDEFHPENDEYYYHMSLLDKFIERLISFLHQHRDLPITFFIRDSKERDFSFYEMKDSFPKILDSKFPFSTRLDISLPDDDISDASE